MSIFVIFLPAVAHASGDMAGIIFLGAFVLILSTLIFIIIFHSIFKNRKVPKKISLPLNPILSIICGSIFSYIALGISGKISESTRDYGISSLGTISSALFLLLIVLLTVLFLFGSQRLALFLKKFQFLLALCSLVFILTGGYFFIWEPYSKNAKTIALVNETQIQMNYPSILADEQLGPFGISSSFIMNFSKDIDTGPEALPSFRLELMNKNGNVSNKLDIVPKSNVLNINNGSALVQFEIFPKGLCKCPNSHQVCRNKNFGNWVETSLAKEDLSGAYILVGIDIHKISKSFRVEIAQAQIQQMEDSIATLTSKSISDFEDEVNQIRKKMGLPPNKRAE